MSDFAPLPQHRRYVFLLDENVGRNIRDYLIASGNRAIESRDVVGAKADDEEIELLGIQESMIIVTHDRDFKTNIRRAIPHRYRKNAPVLWIHVRETRALQRLQQCHERILDHFAYAETHGMRVELMTLSEERIEIVYYFARGQIGT